MKLLTYFQAAMLCCCFTSCVNNTASVTDDTINSYTVNAVEGDSLQFCGLMSIDEVDGVVEMVDEINSTGGMGHIQILNSELWISGDKNERDRSVERLLQTRLPDGVALLSKMEDDVDTLSCVYLVDRGNSFSLKPKLIKEKPYKATTTQLLVEIDSADSKRFATFTSAVDGYRVAIVIGDEVLLAPRIRGTIKSTEITIAVEDSPMKYRRVVEALGGKNELIK